MTVRIALVFLLSLSLPFFSEGASAQSMPDSTREGAFKVLEAEYSNQIPIDNGSNIEDGQVELECGVGSCSVNRTEFRARVYFPAPDPDSEFESAQAHVEKNGPMPLVILVHGQHLWCYDPGTGETSDGEAYPCVVDADADAEKLDIPSYRGYDYIGRMLASHGYIVASLSMNAMNSVRAEHTSRAALIEMHLHAWNDINNGEASMTELPDVLGELKGLVDLRNIGSMGHSRGGAAVVAHHALYNGISPYRVQAVMPMMPSSSSDPTSGVPLGLLMAGCDGDITNLEGFSYFDDSRYTEAGDQASEKTLSKLVKS